jgi:ATP-binding cassette subfamily F protein uup
VAVVANPAPAPATVPVTTVAAAKPRAKLSYKEQRELDALPVRIEALEAEQAQIAQTLAGNEIYVNEPQRVGELNARHAEIEAELMAALERWEWLGGR